MYDGNPPQRFRAIWVSDVHMGARTTQAARLATFLQSIDTEYLYLVGDILDAWKLRKRWYWPQSHSDMVQTVLHKAQGGTKVWLMPGNHDEVLRDFLGLKFGEIELVDECVHTLRDGRRLLVIHGDQFDSVVIDAKWLAFVGDKAYSIAIVVNAAFNFVRRKLGFEYWSLSAYLKHKVKSTAVKDFKDMALLAVRDRKLDGIVCGHTHFAEITDCNGILYCNDGDWMESGTALVEHLDGRLEIIKPVIAEADI